MSAKDEYVVAVKVSPDSQEKIDQLVQAGIFRSRAEAAGFLIDEGIKTQSALFERVQQKLAEIERLRAELRGMVNEKPA
jgi:Arc/MetJ-type ribon-helix-helix transcriptional regulator